MERELHGTPAVQMRFSGNLAQDSIDFWTIAVPQRSFSFLLMYYCLHSRCAELAPLLEKSVDSFRVARKN